VRCPGSFPRRPGRELDGPLLDVLLTERPLPPDAPDRLHAVAGMAASLAGPPEPALA